MGRAKIHIPSADLRNLYVNQDWPHARIAKKYGCSSATVRNRIIELNIPVKTKSQAQSKYAKRDFAGSETERAYILGFRYGDLNVYMPGGESETVVVRCHSTHRVQEEVFKKLFSRYGHITVSRNKYSSHMNCYLNTSFNFLIPKFNSTVLKFLKSKKALCAFTAGYVDAEGTFGINQGKGRFKIDAYDADILQLIDTFLQGEGIHTKYRLLAHKGETKYGTTWNEDLWRLNVNDAQALERFIKKMLPYLLHKKRIKDARNVLRNINMRRKNGTIK